MSPAVSAHGMVLCAGIAFEEMTAVMSFDVSNIAGVCPGPGTLCMRVPAGIITSSGDPGASFNVTEMYADADTRGEGRYPTSRASSNTDRRSNAVRRYASLAMRSL